MRKFLAVICFLYLVTLEAQSTSPSASETGSPSVSMTPSPSVTPSSAITGSTFVSMTQTASQTPSVSASHASVSSTVTITPSPSANATEAQPTILVVVVGAASTGLGTTAVAALSSFITIVVILLLIVLCYAGCVCYRRKACVFTLPTTRSLAFDDPKTIGKGKDNAKTKNETKSGGTSDEFKKRSTRVVPIVTVPENKGGAQAPSQSSGRTPLPPLLRASSVRAVGQILPGTQAPTSLVQKTETGASYVRIKSAKRVRQAVINETEDQAPPPSKTSVSDYDSVVAPGTAREKGSPGRADRHTNDEWLNREGAEEDVSDGEPLDAWVVDDGRDTNRGPPRSPLRRIGSQTARAQAEKADRLFRGDSSVRRIASNNRIDVSPPPPRSSQGLRSPSKRGVTAATVVEEMRHGLASAGSMRRAPSMRHVSSMRNVIEEEGSPPKATPWKPGV